MSETGEPIDRSHWPRGPWDDEPEDHIAFRALGLPAILHRGPLGAWCGYVGVPPGHPWHGKVYDHVDVSVHGGLTYAAFCVGAICHIPEPGESDNVWWLGFDTAHYGDLVPGTLRLYRAFSEGDYRNKRYVAEQVLQLAKQAKAAQ